MMSPSYEAKELWIVHDCMHLKHSACELLQMHLFLPETECQCLPQGEKLNVLFTILI